MLYKLLRLIHKYTFLKLSIPLEHSITIISQEEIINKTGKYFSTIKYLQFCKLSFFTLELQITSKIERENSEIESKLENLTQDPGSTKLITQITKTLCGPVLTYGLYYSDQLTDAFNTINLFNNCHKWFGICSIVIMSSSYITTVLFLKIWMKQNICLAIRYPFEHSKNLLQQIELNWKAMKKGEKLTAVPEEHLIFEHYVSFCAALSESILQLCLSCFIIREFGISSNHFEAFMQLSGILTSLFSVCHCFAKVRSIILIVSII